MFTVHSRRVIYNIACFFPAYNSTATNRLLSLSRLNNDLTVTIWKSTAIWDEAIHQFYLHDLKNTVNLGRQYEVTVNSSTMFNVIRKAEECTRMSADECYYMMTNLPLHAYDHRGKKKTFPLWRVTS